MNGTQELKNLRVVQGVRQGLMLIVRSARFKMDARIINKLGCIEETLEKINDTLKELIEEVGKIGR